MKGDDGACSFLVGLKELLRVDLFSGDFDSSAFFLGLFGILAMTPVDFLPSATNTGRCLAILLRAGGGGGGREGRFLMLVMTVGLTGCFSSCFVGPCISIKLKRRGNDSITFPDNS